MGDIIGSQIESYFTGGKTAKAALDAAAEQTSARFKEQGVLDTPRKYPEVFPDK